MIYLKKNVGFWQFVDRLFLDVYVPLLFASIVEVHTYIYIYTHTHTHKLSIKEQTQKI